MTCPLASRIRPGPRRSGTVGAVLDLLQWDGTTTTIPEATTMDLPIKFPSETEVILDDVARFRALSPSDRVGVIRGLLRTGDRLLQISPKAAWAAKFIEQEENLAQDRIREFLARHGY